MKKRKIKATIKIIMSDIMSNKFLTSCLRGLIHGFTKTQDFYNEKLVDNVNKHV